MTRHSYRVPHMRRIGRGPDTETLYRLEHTAAEALRRATEELGRVLQKATVLEDDASFYRDVLPEALFTMLEAHDSRASLAAALAYLDWYRENRPADVAAALADWYEQRGKKYTLDPTDSDRR